MTQIDAKLKLNKKKPEGDILKDIEDAVKRDLRAPYGRSKLMVVGEGRAGKTSTIKSLMRSGFNPEEESTRGANVQTITVENWEEDDSAVDLSTHVANVVDLKRKIGSENKGDIKDKQSDDEPLHKDNPMPQKGKKKTESEPTRTNKGHPITTQGNKNDDHNEKVRPLPTIGKEEMKILGEAMLRRKKDDDTGIRLTIWDYGGQEVFYALHHLFLTDYGVYMLAFNMKALLDSKTRVSTIEYIQFWLNSKKLHADHAPIILVGTHLDECPTKKEEVNEILEEEVDLLNVEGLVTDESGLSYFPVDNRGGSGVDRLRKLINMTIESADFVKKKVPVSWLRCLDLFMKKDQSCLYTTEIGEEVRTKCGLSLKSFYEMLKFFHRRGMLTYFDHPSSLSNIIVVKPQWLIEGMTLLIYDRRHHTPPAIANNAYKADLRKFKKKGMLTHDLIWSIWGAKKAYSDTRVKSFLKGVMENMLLLCLYKDEEQEDVYRVPSLIHVGASNTEYSYEGPHFLIDFSGEYLTKKELTGLVCYLPFGLFERLVCLCISHSTKYPESMEPKMRLNYAKLSFGVKMTFELVQEKTAIKVIAKSNTTSFYVRELVRIVFSMIETLKKDFIGKKLSISLLLRSEQDVYARYSDLVLRRKDQGNNRAEEFRPTRKKSGTAMLGDYDFWFEDDDEGNLEHDTGEDEFRMQMLTSHKSRRETVAVRDYTTSGREFLELSKTFKYHIFISYNQSGAVDDIVMSLHDLFLSQGYKCWYGNEQDASKKSIKAGINDSQYVVVFLSKGVFDDPLVRDEVDLALKLKKEVLFVHHPDTGTEKQCPFSHYWESAPENLGALLISNGSVPFQRGVYYAQVEMLKQLNIKLGGNANGASPEAFRQNSRAWENEWKQVYSECDPLVTDLTKSGDLVKGMKALIDGPMKLIARIWKEALEAADGSHRLQDYRDVVSDFLNVANLIGAIDGWIKVVDKAIQRAATRDSHYGIFLSHHGFENGDGTMKSYMDSIVDHYRLTLKFGDNKTVPVFLDSRELKAGNPQAESMMFAVCKSDKVMLFLNDSFFTRKWCLMEYFLARNREPGVCIPFVLQIGEPCIPVPLPENTVYGRMEGTSKPTNPDFVADIQDYFSEKNPSDYAKTR